MLWKEQKCAHNWSVLQQLMHCWLYLDYVIDVTCVYRLFNCEIILEFFLKKTGDSPLFKTWRADYKNHYDTYFFSFFSGDIIGLYNESLPSNHITGVVCSISSKLITISIDDSFEDLDQESTYFVVKLANDITYKRLKR